MACLVWKIAEVSSTTGRRGGPSRRSFRPVVSWGFNRRWKGGDWAMRTGFRDWRTQRADSQKPKVSWFPFSVPLHPDRVILVPCDPFMGRLFVNRNPSIHLLLASLHLWPPLLGPLHLEFFARCSWSAAGAYNVLFGNGSSGTLSPIRGSLGCAAYQPRCGANVARFYFVASNFLLCAK